MQIEPEETGIVVIETYQNYLANKIVSSYDREIELFEISTSLCVKELYRIKPGKQNSSDRERKKANVWEVFDDTRLFLNSEIVI